MKIQAKRIESPFLMEATNEDGNIVLMDAGVAVGGKGKGARPTELLLMGVAGCSGIDILSILEKQKQNLTGFTVDVDSEKEKVAQHSEFKKIIVHYSFTGEVDPQKAKRAIELSLGKYCSVSKMLEKSAEITYSFSVNGTKY